MSFNHPQDRHRDRKEQIQQQYKDARDKMSHTETGQLSEDIGHGVNKTGLSDEERRARLEQEMARRLDQAGKEVRREHDQAGRQ